MGLELVVGVTEVDLRVCSLLVGLESLVGVERVGGCVRFGPGRDTKLWGKTRRGKTGVPPERRTWLKDSCPVGVRSARVSLKAA